MPASAARRGGGIRKHQHQRRDRDGDLLMGATPRVSTPRASQKPQHSNSSRTMTELRVTGWTDETDIPKITQFLERHAAKRSPSAKTGGGLAPNMVKSSRVAGDVLTIKVRPEDVPAFSKINGFSFTSATNGTQKLVIAGLGIRSRSPNDTTTTQSSETPSTVALLEGFLDRRYDATSKLLNLSKIAEDEQVSAAGMFNSSSTQSKFFPALMAILNRRVKTATEKRDTFVSVTLSDNNLPNLGVVKDLGFTLPQIKNLDLSGNKFENTKDIITWKHKFRSLEHLILSGNPLESLQPGYEQEIVGWYPRLRILNGQVVRSDAQIAKLDAPKQKPVPSSQNLWLDDAKIAENFLVDFIQGFDNDRSALAQKYYDQDSTFTMSVNARAKGGAGNQHDKTPWDSYLPQSRNLKFINSKRTRFSRKYRGLQDIQKAWSTLPPTRHPALNTNKYSMDCQPQPGLPDPSGQYSGVTGLMLIVHGEYEEHRTAKGANEIVRRAFDRTFVLGPGGPSGVRVVSDMCCFRAAGGVAAWVPQELPENASPPPQSQPTGVPVGLSPEQEAMVMHVHEATRLTLEMATQCLQAGNWDLEAAAQIFNQQKDNLPPDAFITA